jgi:hypothetical protein
MRLKGVVRDGLRSRRAWATPVTGRIGVGAALVWVFAGAATASLAGPRASCPSLTLSVRFFAGTNDLPARGRTQILSVRRRLLVCRVAEVQIIGGRDAPGGSAELAQTRQRVEVVASALKAAGAPQASILTSAAAVGRPPARSERRVTVHIRFVSDRR